MGLVSPQQSNAGETIEASDINNPINQLATVINGNIDATNIADNAISSAKLAANSVTGAKIANYSIVRQNDTTNVTEATARILTGWGIITPGAVNVASETVTFNSAFTGTPIVVLTYGGDSAAGTAYGSGGANVKDSVVSAAYAITTTNFVARFIPRDGTNWAAGNTVFYQWIAIGV